MSRSGGLVACLRQDTRDLHREAERSGIVAELLNRRCTRRHYALYLRNLLPVYEAMETALTRRAAITTYGCIADPRVFRAPRIRQDLQGIEGQAWQQSLPLLPVTRCYAQRVALVAGNPDHCILGHTYTRYLGDLSGGAILRRTVATSLSLPRNTMRYFDFSLFDSVAAYRAEYLDTLDRIVTGKPVESIVAEAVIAFQFNISLSNAIGECTLDASRAEAATTIV